MEGKNCSVCDAAIPLGSSRKCCSEACSKAAMKAAWRTAFLASQQGMLLARLKIQAVHKKCPEQHRAYGC